MFLMVMCESLLVCCFLACSIWAGMKLFPVKVQLGIAYVAVMFLCGLLLVVYIETGSKPLENVKTVTTQTIIYEMNYIRH